MFFFYCHAMYIQYFYKLPFVAVKDIVEFQMAKLRARLDLISWSWNTLVES